MRTSRRSEPNRRLGGRSKRRRLRSKATGRAVKSDRTPRVITILRTQSLYMRGFRLLVVLCIARVGQPDRGAVAVRRPSCPSTTSGPAWWASDAPCLPARPSKSFTSTSSASCATSTAPQRDLILARLEGGPLATTGVIQGMSGSPVYIDGTLVGAVSYALGSFPREPLAGITPIAEMIAAVERQRAVPAAGDLHSTWPATPAAGLCRARPVVGACRAGWCAAVSPCG